MVWYVLDGLDGSGKSTVAEILRDCCEDCERDVILLHHPSDSIPGKISSRFLEGNGKFCEAFSALFFIIDVLQTLIGMRRLEKEYDDIIFVRYSMAAAYLPEHLALPAYKVIDALLPRPERMILVDVEPEVAMQRILKRGEELQVFESLPRLERVRERMLGLSHYGWEILDNSGDLGAAEEAVESLIASDPGLSDSR